MTTTTQLSENLFINVIKMKQYHFFYEFKHGMHCICAMTVNPIEYCGVKDTCKTKQDALKLVEALNA